MIPQSTTVSSLGRRCIVVTGCSWLFLSIASTALADVVEPPPSNCPEGTRGTSSHGGPACRAYLCNDDAGQCDDGLVCHEVDYCVETVREGAWGIIVEVEEDGFCDKSKPCVQGSCQTLRVCVSKNFAEESGKSSQDAGTAKPMDAGYATPDVDVSKPVDANSAPSKRSDTDQSESSDKGNTFEQEPDSGSSEEGKTLTYGCGCVVGRGGSTDNRIGFTLLFALLFRRFMRRY